MNVSPATRDGVNSNSDFKFHFDWNQFPEGYSVLFYNNYNQANLSVKNK